MNKTFNLESFKKGQKAIQKGATHTISFLAVSSKGHIVFEYDGGMVSNLPLENMENEYLMVSRHQALIDNYDPEDTWQISNPHLKEGWVTMTGDTTSPFVNENCDYRLHPHNDLIKAWKKGAKIEQKHANHYWIDINNPSWFENVQYRIKPTTKTVYEWMYKLHGASHFEFIAFADGDNIQYGEQPTVMIKTGRSWEVEV